jgi:hypothetical protein
MQDAATSFIPVVLGRIFSPSPVFTIFLVFDIFISLDVTAVNDSQKKGTRRIFRHRPA